MANTLIRTFLKYCCSPLTNIIKSLSPHLNETVKITHLIETCSQSPLYEEAPILVGYGAPHNRNFVGALIPNTEWPSWGSSMECFPLLTGLPVNRVDWEGMCGEYLLEKLKEGNSRGLLETESNMNETKSNIYFA